jgi:uncharacterized protein (TIGR02246 family)
VSGGAVADELAIRNVLARIAQYADTGDLDDYAALFTEDAHWEMGGTVVRGRAAIRAAGQARRDAGTGGPGSRTRHVIGTIAVTLDGDTAIADSYWHFYGNTDTAPELRAMGAYRDTFRRAGGVWRLAERLITVG